MPNKSGFLDQFAAAAVGQTILGQPPRPREKRAAIEKRRRDRLSQAYQELQNEIPGGSVQKLSKIEILRNATAYIRQLEQQLGIIPDFNELLN